MSSRVIIVRHGETAWNYERRIQGQFDVPLNEVGEAQAQALANALENEAIDRVLSSDLSRAVQTAQIALGERELAIETDPRWRERHFGAMQGRLIDEWSALDAQSYAAYLHFSDPAPAGGESLAAFRARVVAAFEAAGQAEGTTLVLSHGGVLNVLYRLVQNLPDDATRTWGIPNAGVNEFVREDNAWSIVRFGDVGHLDEALDETTA